MIEFQVKVDTDRYLAYINEMAGKIANPGDVLGSAMRKTGRELKELLREEALSKYTVDGGRFDQDLTDSGRGAGGWSYELKFRSSRAIGAAQFQHSPEGYFTTGNRPAAVMGHRTTESGVHVMRLDKSGNKAFTANLNGNTHLAARLGGNRSGLGTVYGPSAVQMVQKALKDGGVQDQAAEMLEGAIEKALQSILR